MDIPEKFKVKLEPAGSVELDKLYDFLFKELNCGWADRMGHYAYDDVDPDRIASNQDGYIYSFMNGNIRVITADSSWGDKDFVELLSPGWLGVKP